MLAREQSELLRFARPGNRDADEVPDTWDPGNPVWNDTAGQWENTWNPNTCRWENRRMGIVYHYDPTLALPVCYDVEFDAITGRYRYHYRPRLPKLPVSPNVFSFSIMRNS